RRKLVGHVEAVKDPRFIKPIGVGLVGHRNDPREQDGRARAPFVPDASLEPNLDPRRLPALGAA
ncbi:MAG: hypothetical protein ACOYN0_08255, partial [Phycisphaerales bacterium]